MNTTPPSLRSANWLYLLTMGLILTLGSFLQTQSIGWGLLATEFGLILLPTLLFIWVGRRAPRAVLRLRWPGWRLVLLGLVIGAGTWGLGIALQGLATTVLGYTPPSAMSALPGDPLSLTVFALALAVAAPLCEETLFRGYLLSAYGRYRPTAALLAVGLLFAFYHLQFSGLVALLPIALVLGLLAHRANSLLPAIAAHFANNSLGAVVAVVTRLNPALIESQGLTVALCGAMMVGPVIALAALWVFLRLTRPPASAAPAPAAIPAPEPAAPRVGRGAWLPLAGAAAIYVAVAALELIMGRFPQVLAARTLDLDPAPFAQPLRLAYTLSNVLDEPVGDLACAFTPQPGVVAYECLTRQRSFEARLGSSFYAGGEYALRQSGRWDAATLHLLEAQLDFEGEFGGWTARVAPAGAGLSLLLNDLAPAPLPADAVLMAEWPFRFMALPWSQAGYFGSRFNHVLLGVGSETGALSEDRVLLRGEEDVPAPAGGSARAWKVQVGQQTAWYAVEPPHTLLRYTDGYGVTWTLETAPSDDLGN